VSGRWRRVRAVLWTDCLFRFRRPSTLVLFLLLSSVAYLWVPDPDTGMALLVIDGRRALYDSTSMALATAVLCSILLGLAGFYLVSHSVARDLRTRCGFVLAATPVGNGEYLLGKLLGNALFLGGLAVGYMVSSMGMQLVRGEAPVEVGVYLWHYALLVPPSLLTVSAVAVLFEAIPRLSGKLGDVAFFVLWMVAVSGGAVASGLSAGGGSGPGIADYFDFGGLGFAVKQITRQLHTTNFSIGATSFDVARPPIHYPGLGLTREWVLPRLTSLFAGLQLFALAWWRFHRFDPDRVRVRPSQQGRGYLQKLDGWLKPVTGWLVARGLRGVGRGAGGRPGLANAVVADVSLTLAESPRSLGALGLFAILSLTLPAGAAFGGLLPAGFLLLALVVAGAGSRERVAGTRGLVASLPGLGSRYLTWKVLGAVVLGLAFLGPLALRSVLGNPGRALSILTGAVFVTAAATALDVIAGTPKAFLLVFLSFWYLVLNDGGAHPVLDFGGFFGATGWRTRGLYLALAAVVLATAFLVERRRVSRL
jgi:hypothetical protein